MAATPASDELIQAIEAFVRSGRGDFEELALAAARWQVQQSRPLERLWRQSGIEPGGAFSWRQIPALPTLAFKQLDVGIGEPQRTFTSSGTSGRPSRHPHAFLDLYRTVIDVSFRRRLEPKASSKESPIDLLSLVPDLDAAPQSSLVFMVDRLIAEHGSGRSGYAWGPRGLQLGKLRSWLAASQRHGAPVVLFATSLALAETLERLARIKLRFRLPPGSKVIHTGGRKTAGPDVDRARLVELLGEHLGVGADALAGEYGMTELTSHFYGRSPDSEDPAQGELFSPPQWTRVRILDPATLDQVADGEVGLIGVLDLANLSSSIHVLTQDLGVAIGDGFRVLGRAEGAELRGCSLLSEQLSA